MEEIDYGLIPDWLKQKIKDALISGGEALANIICKKVFPESACAVAIAAIKGAIFGN